MQFRRNQRTRAEINIAPLVDVIFLLVIFFAVSTSFLDTAGLKLELPSSTSSATRTPGDLTVLMSADGELSFQGQLLTAEQLGDRLRLELRGHERKIVILRADTASSHGDVVRVMDQIREAGAEALTVAARAAGE